MKRILAAAILFVSATSAFAHFTYVVPVDGGAKLQIIFSDTLGPDKNVPIDKIAATTLFSLDRSGRQIPLKWTKSEHALLADLSTQDAQIIGGVTDYGVAQSRHTQNKPVWIKYYPKAIIGDLAATEKVRLGERVPLEIVPVIADGKLRFQVLLHGKPLANAECSVLVPGQEELEKTTTDAEGFTKVRFEKSGRYGIWARSVDVKPGELKGTKYDEVRHYATLVADVPGLGR